MSLKSFSDISFPGHDGCDDYAYGKFSENDLQKILSLVEWLGWRHVDSGVRTEYDGLHVIMIDTNLVRPAIPGYRDEQPLVEHIILRPVKENDKECDEEGEIYITFSSHGFVTPFSEINLRKLINIAEKNGTMITLA